MEMCSPLLPEGMRALIVTHDVDWPLKGPGTAHILARQNRFDEGIISKVVSEGFNPYYGVPTITEIEERFGIRSTFFFRPKYDDGSQVQQYAGTIKALVKNGWEVGLHANNTFICDIRMKTFKAHHSYFVVGAFFNPKILELHERVLFVPTKVIEQIGTEINASGEIRRRITTLLSTTTKSKWAPYIIDKKDIANKIFEKFQEIERYLK